MASDQNNSQQTTGQNQLRVWALVAAVVVIAGALIVTNLGGSDEDPSATPTTVVVTTASEDTAPATTPPTTIFVDPWEEIPILFFSGPAGEYRTGTSFVSEFKVSLPEGWARAFPEHHSIVEVSPTAEACETDQALPACEGLITVVDPPAQGVEAAVAHMRALNGVDTTEPVPVEVGGAKGVVFDMTTDLDRVTVNELEAVGVVRLDTQRHFETYVLDVAGTTIMLYIDSPRASAPFAGAEDVLQTIVWRDLQ